MSTSDAPGPTDDSIGESDKDDSLSVEEPQAHLGASGGLDRRRTIIGAVVAVVFLGIIFWRVIPQVGDYAQAAQYLQDMTPAVIAALVAVVAFYLFIYGWPFVAATPGLRYRQGFVVNQSAFVISNGIPGGGAFGLGLQFAQLVSYRVTPTAATAAIGATGVWSIFITLGLPITGIAALAAAGDDSGRYAVAAAVGVAVLAAVVGTFALILRSEPLARRIGRFGDRMVNPVLAKFGRGWHVDLTSGVIQLRHDIVGLVRRRWIVITLTQIAVSWSQFAILYTALWGVSGDSGTVTVLAAYGSWAISQLGILIPVTPGGLGTVDATLIALLQTVGADAGQATAAALVWRASSYIPQMVVGLVSIAYWRYEEGRRRRTSAVTD